MNNTAMFRALLFVQWKLQRVEILALTLVAALISPIAISGYVDGRYDRMGWLTGMIGSGSLIKPGGALLAVALGTLLAVRPFLLDARARHTYALALPIPRARYALMRAATGLTLCLVPAMGFLIGALVAVESIPDTLWVRKFPVALTVRFLLSVATAFAIAFGFQYGLGGRAKRWLLILAVAVVAFEIFGQVVLRGSMVQPLVEFLSGAYSPVRLFRDRWVLFDV
jgi:hypothetical protein